MAHTDSGRKREIRKGGGQKACSERKGSRGFASTRTLANRQGKLKEKEMIT